MNNKHFHHVHYHHAHHVHVHHVHVHHDHVHILHVHVNHVHHVHIHHIHVYHVYHVQVHYSHSSPIIPKKEDHLEVQMEMADLTPPQHPKILSNNDKMASHKDFYVPVNEHKKGIR